MIKKVILRWMKFVYKNVYCEYIPLAWQWHVRALGAKACLRGRGVYIHPSVHMTGSGNVFVGSYSSIGEDTWLNVNRRMKGKIEISIGENCFIGRRNFFTSGSEIRIGDYCLTAVECKFICANHVYSDPSLPYIASGLTYNSSILVGVNCFFGAGSVVIGNITVGHGSVIGAGAFVNIDVPPFSLVVGNPGRIIKRYSFSKQAWIRIDELVSDDLVDNPDEQTYLKVLRRKFPKIPMPLAAAGSSFGNI